MSDEKVVKPLIVVEMKRWRMKDYRQFMKATQESNFEDMFGLLSKVVVAWPYEGDPSVPESYDGLTMDEWLAVTKAVGASLTNQFSQGN
jgi:hypothetical protein